MQLSEYANILWRRKWVIVLVVLSTVLSVMLLNQRTEPLYKAQAKLRVLTSSEGSLDYTERDVDYGARLMNTYAEVVVSNDLIELAREQLELDEAPEVTARAVDDTEILIITAQSHSPEVASAFANKLGELLIENTDAAQTTDSSATITSILEQRIGQLEDEIRTAQREYDEMVSMPSTNRDALSAIRQSITLKEDIYASFLLQYEQSRIREQAQRDSVYFVEQAQTPASADGKDSLRLVLGSVAGLVGGLVVVSVFENLDSRLRSTKEFRESSRLHILGQIPRRLLSFRAIRTSPADVDVYNHLRTHVLDYMQGHDAQSVLFVSTRSGDGKSTVLANLAVSLGRLGHRVLIIDGDLRGKQQHRIFKVSNEIGLANLLENCAPLEDCLCETGYDNISLLPAGQTETLSTDLLSASSMASLMGVLAEDYEYILIDSPGFVDLSDASILLGYADASLVLADFGNTQREDFSSMMTQLEQRGASVMGLVLNQVDRQNRLY